jgi:hypothetical protein
MVVSGQLHRCAHLRDPNMVSSSVQMVTALLFPVFFMWKAKVLTDSCIDAHIHGILTWSVTVYQSTNGYCTLVLRFINVISCSVGSCIDAIIYGILTWSVSVYVW